MKRIINAAIIIMVLSVFCIALSACSSKPSVSTGDSLSFQTEDMRDQQNTTEETTTTTPEPAPVAEETSATTTPTSSSGVVVIDAGHQAQGDSGQEPIGPGASETKARVTDGAAGVVTGNDESVINLDVALKLRDALEARGITVIMVRESNDVDISNAERAEVANNANADLFIRLHCDGVDDDSSINGFLTLVPGDNEWTDDIYAESQRAGDIMHPIIISEIGATDRGVVERDDLSGFNWCDVPCVLFEMGLLSNPDEDVALGTDEYQQTLANAIADATVTYLNSR